MTTSEQSPKPENKDLPLQPARRLRELLDSPKPKLEKWQDEASRMASLLAVQFPQEADDATALSIVALVGLASAIGVKTAKKRSLKLTRWAKTPPPPIQTLTRLDEQRAVIVALTKVKSPWTITYVEKALSSSELAPEFLPELLRWARTAAPDWVTFVVESYAPSVASCTESTRVIAMLKDAPKLLTLSDAVPADKVAEALSTLVRVIIGSASRFGEDAKVPVPLLQKGFAIIEQAWHGFPALLMQPVLVNVLTQLSMAIRAEKKQPPGSVETASLATLFIVSDSVRRYGVVAMEQCRPLLPLWKAAYPDFQEQVKGAAIFEPALAGLLSNERPENQVQEQSYSTEAAFASLLPAWDAFMAELSDPSQASSLTLMLHRAAGTVHVERQGVVGETVGYDPLSHHLADPGEVSPIYVKILRAGVAARRVDGSMRTLVQALVTAV